jgi:hypothetical protein
MRKKTLKARVKSTGLPVKVQVEDIVNTSNIYKDIKTGGYYYDTELQFEQSRHMWQLGFHVGRFGMFVFVREYIKYNVWYLLPGIAVSAVNGYDRYVDAEVKFLFFGFGVRFIWVKKK